MNLQTVQELPLDQSSIRKLIFDSFLEEPPKTDEELHWWIKTFTGYDIPRRPSGICPDHVAPFSFIADQFFERSTSTFGFANRSGGKTFMTAILNLCDLIFRPGISIVLVGAVRHQAQEGYRYMLELIGGDPLIASMLQSDPTMDRTTLTNGSWIRITVCSYSGLNGPHPTRLRWDEVELIHQTYIAEGLSITQSHPSGYKAQDTFTSTRKISSGTVQKLFDEKDQRMLEVKGWCVWENLEKCTRQCKGDPVHGDCPAYAKLDKDGNEKGICGIIDGPEERHRRADAGLPVYHGRAQKLPDGGYYKLEDFIRKVALMDRLTFETQWLNYKPTGGALVYGEFFKSESPFVCTTKEALALLERARRDGNWMRVVGIDFGSHFSAEYFMKDPMDGVWYGYYELYWTPDQDMSLELRARRIREADPLGWSKRTMVFADPSGRQQITDLGSFPGAALDAVPANNDVFAGINHIKGLYERRTGNGMPMLRHFSIQKQLIKEHAELYVHPIMKTGDVDRDKILKKNDHCSDACRYAMLSVDTIGTQVYNRRKLRGVW